MRRALAQSATIAALILAACGGSASPSAPASTGATSPAAAPASASATGGAAAASGAASTAAGASSGGSAAPASGGSATAGAASASGSARSSSAGAAPASGAPAGAVQVQPLAQRVKVNLAVSPNNMDSLPLFLALDDGSLSNAGLDMNVTKIQGSATAVLPELAQGKVDFLLVGVGPGLYNQAAQGFGAKIIASDGIEKQGRFTADLLTVLKDKANDIKDLKDLKGKTVDGALPGSPMDMLARAAIEQAGLTPGKDVTLQYNAKTPPDMIALAKNKGADVIGMIEPIATQMQQQGLVVKWKTDADVIPWYQPGELAVSQSFLSANQAAAEKFLEIYLAESRRIDATNGDWSSDLMASATKWTQVPADVVKAMGGVPYFDPNGAVSMDSLRMTQDFWIKAGQLKQPIDVNTLVDQAVLSAAVKSLGQQ